MKFFSCKSRRVVSPKLRTAKPRMLPLEDRLAPAGFGPEDGAYIVESRAGAYSDVKIQPGDQKIVAAGSGIARFDSLGNPDPSFGVGGLTIPTVGGGGFGGLVLQADGKAVVSTNVSGYLGVERFRTNGTLDTTFSGDGWTTVNASPGQWQNGTGISLQSTGQIVVGGDAWTVGGSGSVFERDAIMAGFKSNGALNSGKGGFGNIVNNKSTGFTVNTFGGATAEFNSILVRPDNKILAVGAFNTVGTSVHHLLVARNTANGVLDTTFNGTGYTILSLPGIAYTSVLGFSSGALQPDGKIVVVSTSQDVDGVGSERDMLITRFNANGTLDTGFGGGAGFVRLDVDGAASPTLEHGTSVVLQPDGKIVAVGYVSGSPKTVLVARVNIDGTLDSTFGDGGFKLGTQAAAANLDLWPLGAARQSDGSIIVVGGQDLNGHPFLMRFFGDSPLRAAGGAAVTSSDVKPLDMTQVKPLLHEALTRWQIAGGNVASLNEINIRIADLGGSTLGLASGNTIWLDDNAAGHGWFADPTPGNDSEFSTRGNQGEQRKIDLLTTLMHEVGHLLGQDHDEGGVMQETLGVGQRLTPHGVYVGDADPEIAPSVERERANGRRTGARLRR